MGSLDTITGRARPGGRYLWSARRFGVRTRATGNPPPSARRGGQGMERGAHRTRLPYFCRTRADEGSARPPGRMVPGKGWSDNRGCSTHPGRPLAARAPRGMLIFLLFPIPYSLFPVSDAPGGIRTRDLRTPISIGLRPAAADKEPATQFIRRSARLSHGRSVAANFRSALPHSRTHALFLPPAGVADGARTRASGVTIRRSVRLSYGLHLPGVLRRPAGTPRPLRGVALFHTSRDCERPAGPVLIRHRADLGLLSVPGLAQNGIAPPGSLRGRGDGVAPGLGSCVRALGACATVLPRWFSGSCPILPSLPTDRMQSDRANSARRPAPVRPRMRRARRPRTGQGLEGRRSGIVREGRR
jgi:hypothetical protein